MFRYSLRRLKSISRCYPCYDGIAWETSWGGYSLLMNPQDLMEYKADFDMAAQHFKMKSSNVGENFTILEGMKNWLNGDSTSGVYKLATT